VRKCVASDLTDVEVARLVGKHPRTIQRWCQDEKLPGAYKAGRSWRIPRRALRGAGLPGTADGEDYVRELSVATRVVEEIAAELRELRELGFWSEPRVRRDWSRTVQDLRRLEQALEGLSSLAGQVPERLQRRPR
jgi:excisionase family DNA binding protein